MTQIRYLCAESNSYRQNVCPTTISYYINNKNMSAAISYIY